MIDVKYYQEANSLRMDGHAGSGEYGKDLVCAAATQTSYIFAQAVENLCLAGMAKEPKIIQDQGHCDITCTPCEEYEDQVRLILMTICAGFDILQKHYKDFIKYEVI